MLQTKPSAHENKIHSSLVCLFRFLLHLEIKSFIGFLRSHMSKGVVRGGKSRADVVYVKFQWFEAAEATNELERAA